MNVLIESFVRSQCGETGVFYWDWDSQYGQDNHGGKSYQAIWHPHSSQHSGARDGMRLGVTREEEEYGAEISSNYCHKA